MGDLESAARTFLAEPRIAVVGVSRQGDVAANGIYRRLRRLGYGVVPVNPNTDEVEGDTCYRSIREIPGGVNAAVIGTAPAATADAVRACAEAGVRSVWIHGGIGSGSLSDDAVRAGEEAGMTVIAGSCPLMFCDPTDPAHRCLRWIQRVTGRHVTIVSGQSASA